MSHRDGKPRTFWKSRLPAHVVDSAVVQAAIEREAGSVVVYDADHEDYPADARHVRLCYVGRGVVLGSGAWYRILDAVNQYYAAREASGAGTLPGCVTATE